MSEDIFESPAKCPGVSIEYTTAYENMELAFKKVLWEGKHYMWDIVERVRRGEVFLKTHYWVDVGVDEVEAYYARH